MAPAGGPSGWRGSLGLSGGPPLAALVGPIATHAAIHVVAAPFRQRKQSQFGGRRFLAGGAYHNPVAALGVLIRGALHSSTSWAEMHVSGAAFCRPATRGAASGGLLAGSWGPGSAHSRRGCDEVNRRRSSSRQQRGRQQRRYSSAGERQSERPRRPRSAG